MSKVNNQNDKNTKQNAEPTLPEQAPLPPSGITPPTVTPYNNAPKKIRPSEIVIILAIVFGCIICGLLTWGVVALIRQLPVWWHNLFGMAVSFFTV